MRRAPPRIAARRGTLPRLCIISLPFATELMG